MSYIQRNISKITLATILAFAMVLILSSCGQHSFDDWESWLGLSSSSNTEMDNSSSSVDVNLSSSGNEQGHILSSSSKTNSSSSSKVSSSSFSSGNFNTAEEQRINIIKSRYKPILENYQANATKGDYFITVPTIKPYTTGKVKNEILQSGLDVVNFVRYIAGIPDDIVLDAEYTDLCQHGAVLLTAVGELTHTPSKPADMEQAFYDKGYQGTTHSNLSTWNFPPGTVFGYMDDSSPSNISKVGHRRWVLNPPMKKSGFGVGATDYGCMYSFDKSRGDIDYDYVAWPSPGVFPTDIFSNNTAWNISVNTQKYGNPDIDKIEVALKHINSGKVWTFSKSTQSSTANRSAYFNVDKGGTGIKNAIIFRPALERTFKYKDGDVFQVTVSGLDKDLSYTVKMFTIEEEEEDDDDDLDLLCELLGKEICDLYL